MASWSKTHSWQDFVYVTALWIDWKLLKHGIPAVFTMWLMWASILFVFVRVISTTMVYLETFYEALFALLVTFRNYALTDNWFARLAWLEGNFYRFVFIYFKCIVTLVVYVICTFQVVYKVHKVLRTAIFNRLSLGSFCLKRPLSCYAAC